jgi:predicted histidine transporter YuiF (NhaC family)
MSEKELGRALLALDADKLAGAPDARQQTWKILERDRRRIWWLTALTIALWAAAVVMVLAMLVAFGLIFPLQAHLIQEAQQFNRMPPEVRQAAQHKAQIAFQMATVGVTCSVGLLAFAALSTLVLLVVSRRATLRQINASLLEISQQLKELRQATPPMK